MVCLAAAGCPATRTVTVRVRTDLTPGVEVDQLVVQGARAWQRPVLVGDDLARPVELASITGLSPGAIVSFEVSARLRGDVVLTRRRAHTVQNDAVVVVILSRNCREHMCPPPTDPQATECLDGTCVTPECDEAAGCPPTPRCSADGDCAASVDCSVGVCVSGVCLDVPDPSRCAAGQACVPETGCVEVETSNDAGVDLDAGARDVGVDRDAAGRDAHSTSADAARPEDAAPEIDAASAPTDDARTTPLDAHDPAELVCRPAMHDFGSITAGSRSSPMTFTIENVGGSATEALLADFDWGDLMHFAITANGCAGRVLEPGRTCDLELEFRPRNSGTKLVSLLVASESSMVNCSATGVGE